jgi:hypothetical protein
MRSGSLKEKPPSDVTTRVVPAKKSGVFCLDGYYESASDVFWSGLTLGLPSKCPKTLAEAVNRPANARLQRYKNIDDLKRGRSGSREHRQCRQPRRPRVLARIQKQSHRVGCLIGRLWLRCFCPAQF